MEISLTFVSSFQMVLSDETQSLVGAMLQLVEIITNMMNKMGPAIGQLQSYLLSIENLNLVANNEFKQVCSIYIYILATQS